VKFSIVKINIGDFKNSIENLGIMSIFEAAVENNSNYLPNVSDGTTRLADWFFNKTPIFALAAYSHSTPVGFVMVRESKKLPNGKPIPNGLRFEICRLAVHPRYRNQEIASTLISECLKHFPVGSYLTCQKNSTIHRMCLKNNWEELMPITFLDDPAPGVLMRYENTY